MSDAERVLRLLTNADTTQADMAFVLGLSIRQVQSALQQLRLAGHPILSNGDGIRLAQTADEALACAAALRKRALHQWVTARALRRTGRAMRVREDAAARATLWDFWHGEGAAS
jgi:biotin operon repressor